MELTKLYPINSNLTFQNICYNSKLVKPGDLFICLTGANHDGHNYADEAEKLGAVVIIANRPLKCQCLVIVVEDTKKELARISKIFFGEPAIKLIGVTGTDGKTTTTSIIAHLLNAGYIGTNGISYHHHVKQSINTTPNSYELFKTFNLMNKANIKDVALEVSSEAILDSRIKEMTFDYALFTNLSHEHFNAHHNFENYYQTKKQLFLALKPQGTRIINVDDEYGARLFSEINGKKISYGIKNGEVQATNIVLHRYFTTFDLRIRGKVIVNFKVNLFGIYNIYNVLAAICVCLEYQMSFLEIRQKLLSLPQISGRFEVIKFPTFDCIIDFAHTPNALNVLLSNLQQIKLKRIILVVGCAGGKDATKRSLMGQTASMLADVVFFTSEDPRHERVEDIIAMMIKDIKKLNYQIVYERKKAIKQAIAMANKDDIVVICGKGREQFEIIGQTKVAHSDYDIVNLLNASS